MLEYNWTFLKKYQKARDEKDSILCAGFDPALPVQRKKDIVPEKYIIKENNIETVFLDFLEDFLEEVKNYCCAIKPNNQFLFHFSLKAYEEMNKLIHNNGLISILDQKIGDIGSTNDAGFYWMNRMGFDATTFSPFAGNIQESITSAHNVGLGLITLTLMSNPEAIYFMKEGVINGKKGYEFIAEQIKLHQGDGMVVGATGHVTGNDVQKIRAITGKEPVMLVPGIGSQQGEIEKIILNGGENIILNVGRAIIYSENIAEAAKTYNNKFNEIRKRL